MEVFRTVVLVAATVVMGVMGGIFFLYSNTIMPGLGRTDDRTFVGAFQAIDTRIINPVFMSMFFGGLVLSGAAVFLHLGDQFRSVLPWLMTALALYAVVLILTITVNVPLNDYIKAAGDPDQIDVADVRGTFNEKRWVRSNHIRTLLTLIAFVCLCWALLERA